ncbi:MAG: class I SAM-dependent methyltransferase, partial [Candidatus Thorarchaeota archaeon]
FINNFKCYLLDLRRYRLPKGVYYIGNNLKNLSIKDKFDIILMLHTLEHVHNPREILKDIYNHLNENGIIVIQVPLGCMREWKSLKNPYVHVNFFSEQSLYNCVRLAGLKVLHIKTEITKFTRYRSWQLNIVATKRVEGTVKTISINNLLSTRQQQIRLSYYLLYFFFNFFKLIFKKKLKLFTSS